MDMYLKNDTKQSVPTWRFFFLVETESEHSHCLNFKFSHEKINTLNVGLMFNY